MIQGLYSAAAGMNARMDQQDAISNNLANVSTPGYRRKVATFSTFDAQLQTAARTTAGSSSTAAADPPALTPSVSISEDTTQGLLQQTNVSTDFALDGPGSFVLQTASGEKTTRAGNFHLDGSGHLLASDGSAVLGERGPIQVSGSQWSVDSEGTVWVGKTAVDKLKIENPAGTKGTTRVLTGQLESSNVNTVQEMVSMISAMRSYEACSKVIQSLDQTMDKSINTMSR